MLYLEVGGAGAAREVREGKLHTYSTVEGGRDSDVAEGGHWAPNEERMLMESEPILQS